MKFHYVAHHQSALHVVITFKLLAGFDVPVIYRLQDVGEADAEIYSFLAEHSPASLTIVSTRLLTETHSAVLKALQVSREAILNADLKDMQGILKHARVSGVR